MPDNYLTLPDNTQHHLIIGMNGSGKTQFGIYTLSQRSITSMPWVVMNFKDDELIDAIPHAQHLSGMELPKKLTPGIWVVHPDVDDWDGSENLMLDIWRRTHIGLFVDEALALSEPRHRAYRKLLTQGRSRRNPVISLTQRPVDIDRYAFSESKFKSIFDLQDDRELLKIKDQTGILLDMGNLPKYWSYKVTDKKLSKVEPAPDFDTILSIFDKRLGRMTSSHMI